LLWERPLYPGRSISRKPGIRVEATENNVLTPLKNGVFFILKTYFMSIHTTHFKQVGNFDKLADKMFFNIFIHQPDKLVIDFIKKYFPAFSTNPKRGGWTLYPN